MSSLLGRFRTQLRYLAGYLDTTDQPMQRRTDFAHCGRPVLLLHGFWATRRTLEVLERRLRRDGYCVFSVKLGAKVGRALATEGIDDLAEHVRVKVERLYARYPEMGPLTIIGHSKGGLIGAYYVKKLGGWRRTRALLTLGTPHQGTPTAYLGLPLWPFARSLWQMTPASSLLRRLRQGAWPPGVRLVSFYSRRDKVTPLASALVETHGLPYLRNVEVEADGHRQFLYRKKIYDKLLAELREGETMAPVRIGNLSLVQGGAGGRVAS